MTARLLAQLDRRLAQRVSALLTSHGVPGAAVAVVDGRRDYLLLHGVKQAGGGEAVTPATAFDVGSCAKSYVAAALGILADRAVVRLDQPIRSLVPELDFGDAWMNEAASLRDMLSNRMGLARVRPIEAFPNEDIGPLEIIARVKHLPRAKLFRSGYIYNNIGFIACAIAVERAASMKYADFLRQELFAPLGMKSSASGRMAVECLRDRSRSHCLFGGRAQVLPERVFDNTQGAGSIYSSGADALRWLRLHLAEAGTSKAWPIRSATLRELHRPHTVMQMEESSLMHRPPEAKLCAYALGWATSQLHGERIVQHAGGMFGWFAQTSLIPERGVAVAVYLNARREIHHAIAYMVLEHLLGAAPRDWADIAAKAETNARRTITAQVAKLFPCAAASGTDLALADYCGRYRHPAAGTVEVIEQERGLYVRQLDGRLWDLRLKAIGAGVFAAKFADAAINEYLPTGFRVRFTIVRGRAAAFEEPAVRYDRCD